MSIIGHTQQIQLFETLITEQKLPHALLLTGPQGIGKQRVAIHLVQRLFCKSIPPCRSCDVCNRVEKHIHPDLFFLEAEESSLKIESIRELKQKLSIGALEAPVKVALFNDAHEMTPAAANALLKTLEEPPPDTYLILITHLPHRLLKTILSRCQKFSFAPLSAAETQQVLKQSGHHLSEKRIQELVEVLGGVPGQLLKFQEEWIDLVQTKILPAFWGPKKDLLTLFEVAEEIAQDPAMQKPILDLLKIELHRKLLQEAALKTAEQLKQIERAGEDILQNANVQLTFEALFVQLCL